MGLTIDSSASLTRPWGASVAKPRIVVKKTSTGIARNDGRTIKRYIAEYMDETQKGSAKTKYHYTYEKARQKRVIEEVVVDGIVEQHKAEVPALRAGVDYLTKEKKGKVGVHGFIRSLVEIKTGRKIAELNNDEVAVEVEEIWRALLAEKRLKKIAHKFVFSLDPELTKEMVEKKIPVDEHLNRIVHETLRRYQEKFYPGQELGYLTGIHHDRRHIHCHVLLYPQTGEGKPLNVSRASERPNLEIISKATGSPRKFRHDYQGFITAIAVDLARELEIMVKSVPSRSPKIVDYPQERLLSQTAWDEVVASGVSPSPQPAFTEPFLARRRELEKAPESDVKKVMLKAYANAAADYDALTPEQATARIKYVDETRPELAKWLKKSTPARILRPTPLGDVAMARGILVGTQWVEWDGAGLGEWWGKREKGLPDPEDTSLFVRDDLSFWMIKTREELTSSFAHFDRDGVILGGQLTYQRKRILVDRYLLELQALRIRSQAQAQKKRDDYLKAREARLDRVTFARYADHVMTRQKQNAKAKLAGDKPTYLLHYEGWKARGVVDIPLDLPCRDASSIIAAKLEHRREVIANVRPITPEEIMERLPEERKMGSGDDAVKNQDCPGEVENPEAVIPPNLPGPASLDPIIALEESPAEILDKVEEIMPDQAALDELGLEL